MRTRVTAVVVATKGSAWLADSLAALAAQTLQPDRVLAVDMGVTGATSANTQLFSEAGVERIVTSRHTVSFGKAIDLALAAANLLDGDEWVWLLSHDSAPEPDALERIIATVQRAPSVAVAGPKLVDWNDPSQIIEIGQTVTDFGKRWQLARPELDQEQYDDKEDVLAVGPAGMLVRRSVWRDLGGFDPALPVYDDGLDFGIRARLAGHRVVLAPDSKVRFGGDGVAGPRISRRRSVARHNWRLDRAAQLHRRLVYANGFLAAIFWLWLPALGVLRMVWSLIREQPGRIGAEFLASMAVFFSLGSVARARRQLRSTNTSGWGAIAPLRVDNKTVRTTRMIDREAILDRQGRKPKERHFISSGGLTVLLSTTVASLALFWWMFGATFLTGGALLPLSTTLADLWANTQPTAMLPADPFAWVLAVLGTITFWNPSLSIVLLVTFAIPLGAFAAWMWASDITESPLGRALAAIIWALSPVLLIALSEGRLPTIILAVSLPWLLLAGTRAGKSWGWAAVTSLLAGVVLASAPSLGFAAIVFLVIGIVTAGAGLARVLLVPVVPVVLFAPLIWHELLSGDPLSMFIDPGVLTAYAPASTWSLLIGFPEAGLAGWPALFEALGIGGLPLTVIVGILLIPIAALGMLGLYVTQIRQTLTGVLLAGLGLLTALIAPNMLFASVGSEAVALYTGSGIMLYWLGLATLVASGIAALAKAAPAVTAVAMVTLLVAVAPILAGIATANTAITPDTPRLPALVRATAQTQPDVGTIVLTAQPDASVASVLDRGTGITLDDVRTARFAGTIRQPELELAELTGALLSPGATDVGAALAREGIEFIVLTAANEGPARVALIGTLDANPDLTSIGPTEAGDLWRVDTDATAEPLPANSPSLPALLFWVLQLLVIIVVALLALPTAEVVDRPERRPRVGSKKWREQQAELRNAERAGADVSAESGDTGFDYDLETQLGIDAPAEGGTNERQITS